MRLTCVQQSLGLAHFLPATILSDAMVARVLRVVARLDVVGHQWQLCRSWYCALKQCYINMSIVIVAVLLLAMACAAWLAVGDWSA